MASTASTVSPASRVSETFADFADGLRRAAKDAIERYDAIESARVKRALAERGDANSENIVGLVRSIARDRSDYRTSIAKHLRSDMSEFDRSLIPVRDEALAIERTFAEGAALPPKIPPFVFTPPVGIGGAVRVGSFEHFSRVINDVRERYESEVDARIAKELAERGELDSENAVDLIRAMQRDEKEREESVFERITTLCIPFYKLLMHIDSSIDVLNRALS
jgi:hypothetical protein